MVVIIIIIIVAVIIWYFSSVNKSAKTAQSEVLDKYYRFYRKGVATSSIEDETQLFIYDGTLMVSNRTLGMHYPLTNKKVNNGIIMYACADSLLNRTILVERDDIKGQVVIYEAGRYATPIVILHN